MQHVIYRARDSVYSAARSWLQARHHFSFGDYQDPQWVQHGALRVLNDDAIASRGGFPLHPHDNMEIVTFVRTGAITHEDNMGNKGRTEAGNVQVMSAGTGVQHSEYNLEDASATLFQIWFLPHTQQVTPRWEQRQFARPDALTSDAPPDVQTLLVSGMPEDAGSEALFIHQHTRIWAFYSAESTRQVEFMPTLPFVYGIVSEGEGVLPVAIDAETQSLATDVAMTTGDAIMAYGNADPAPAADLAGGFDPLRDDATICFTLAPRSTVIMIETA